MPSSHLILCHPLLLLPQIPPSIRVFSNESTLLMRWPKYWSFSFSISPSNEHPGLISFRMDWLDLLAVQGTLNSLQQHHSSKVSILRCSAFFTVQLSHPYMTTGKTIDRPFLASVMSNSLWPHELQPARLLCPWGFPGKNTGMGCPFLHGIFPTQGPNPSLLYYRQILYLWATRENPINLGLMSGQVESQMTELGGHWPPFLPWIHQKYSNIESSSCWNNLETGRKGLL